MYQQPASELDLLTKTPPRGRWFAFHLAREFGLDAFLVDDDQARSDFPQAGRNVP